MRLKTVGALFALLVVTLLFTGVGAARAPAAGVVSVEASVDGQKLGTSSQIQPVKLFPRDQSVLAVTVTNGGPTPIDVRQVRLEGQVIGLTFFSYDTAVSMSVAPGATESQHLVIDLSGLNGQATGLIPGAVEVLDRQHHVLAQQDGVVDVRGSLRSVYGLFGLGVAFLTLLSFLGAVIGLARHRLPVNRWRRGLRFLTPGIGLGLVVNFTLSATRVFVPGIGRWATITVVSALVLFGLGYLTPTPELDEEADEAMAAAIAAAAEEATQRAIAARPAQPALAAQRAPVQLAAEPPAPAIAPPVTDLKLLGPVLAGALAPVDAASHTIPPRPVEAPGPPGAVTSLPPKGGAATVLPPVDAGAGRPAATPPPPKSGDATSPHPAEGRRTGPPLPAVEAAVEGRPTGPPLPAVEGGPTAPPVSMPESRSTLPPVQAVGASAAEDGRSTLPPRSGDDPEPAADAESVAQPATEPPAPEGSAGESLADEAEAVAAVDAGPPEALFDPKATLPSGFVAMPTAPDGSDPIQTES